VVSAGGRQVAQAGTAASTVGDRVWGGGRCHQMVEGGRPLGATTSKLEREGEGGEELCRFKNTFHFLARIGWSLGGGI
jgi:hypothetical protein